MAPVSLLARDPATSAVGVEARAVQLHAHAMHLGEATPAPNESVPIGDVARNGHDLPLEDGADEDPLDAICRQQRAILMLVVEYRRSVAAAVGRRTMLQRVRRIIETVKENFAFEEEWLQVHAHHSHRTQWHVHQKVIEELLALRDALGGTGELASTDLLHSLDSLVLYYVVDDLFCETGHSMPRFSRSTKARRR